MIVRRLLSAVFVIAAMGAMLVANQTQETNSAPGMTKAAQGFLKQLTDAQRQKTSFARVPEPSRPILKQHEQAHQRAGSQGQGAAAALSDRSRAPDRSAI